MKEKLKRLRDICGSNNCSGECPLMHVDKGYCLTEMPPSTWTDDDIDKIVQIAEGGV